MNANVNPVLKETLDAFSTERALVAEHRGHFSTEYRISGSLKAVLLEIEALFHVYHPHGYGTMVHAIEMVAGGKYGARMSRANSAD